MSKHKNFMKPSNLSDEEEKFCRCVLHVKAKGGAYNPYAVCARSVGTTSKSCGEHYDFDIMPLPELLAYADLKKLRIRDRSDRSEIIDRIMRWKAQKYGS